MATICHVSTGSNMKHLIIYPDASPHGPSPKRSYKGIAIVIWLALAPLALSFGQVSITCPTTVTISCNTIPSPGNTGSAIASTNCSNTAITLTYQDNNSQMNGCMGTGVLKRTWRATDQCSNVATCLQNIVIEDNTSPTLTCPSFAVISCNSDTTPAALGMAIAFDNCTPQNQITITYNDHTQNLNLCNGTGSFTRHWQAIDMCGNIAVCIQTIVVNDTQKPVLTLPPAITITCNQSTNTTITGTATAVDNCTPSVNVNFSDNVQGMTGCNGTGTIVRSWSAADACNNIATGTQFITVIDNTTPAITCPPSITISCEASTLPANTGSATASDLCGPAFIGYADELLQPLACNGTGVIKRTWSALDACNNLTSCAQFITIIDQVKPTITCPQNITLDCSLGIQPVVTGTPVIADNCTPSGNLILTRTDVEVAPLGCNGTGTIRRTWNVTDACGNSSSCVQTITVTDLLKPTISCPPPITISCESPRTPDATGAASALDNCTPVGSIAVNYPDDVSGIFG